MDLRAVAFAILKGCYDSITGISAIFTINNVTEERARNSSPYKNTSSRKSTSDKKRSSGKNKGKSDMKRSICLCSFMNGGVFLFSILLFNFVILPSIQMVCHLVFPKDSLGQLTWVWIEPIVSFVFTSLWVVPLFLISRIVNNLWFQDIADCAYMQKRGRPPSWESGSIWIADTVFNLAIQPLFLIQAMLVSYIPIHAVGYIFYLMHMCLIYSLYAFEYKWYNMTWQLNKRVAYLEKNWPYFIGFGFPLAIITQMSDSWIVSGSLFSLLFPFFIISSTDANPIDNVSIYPLRLFSPMIKLADKVSCKILKRILPQEVIKQMPKSQTNSVQRHKSHR